MVPPTLPVVPGTNPPTNIPLGANFCTILGSSTVTNTGATVVTGDVCLTPGSSIVGFPPGTIINGAKHINDARAIQAKSETQTLFTGLQGLPCDFSFGVPTDLGTQPQPLTPGVYCFATSAAITGTITLRNVGTSATLGTNTTLQGRIIAGASVTITGGATLLGRAAALSGAVTMDTNVVTPPL